MESDIGTMLVVAALFAIVLGYYSRVSVGPEDAIVGAAAVPCQGLTGATLVACKKAQPTKVIKTRFENLSQPIRPYTKNISPTNPITQCYRRNGVWQNGRCLRKRDVGIHSQSIDNLLRLEDDTRDRCAARALAFYRARIQATTLKFVQSRGYKTVREFLNDASRTRNSLWYQYQHIINQFDVLINNHRDACIRAAGYSTKREEGLSLNDSKTGGLLGFPYAV